MSGTLENSPSKIYPGKHTLTSLYTWQTCGAFRPVPRARCLLHAKHIIHSTFVLLMPTCSFSALPDTFMQHHQTLPCTKLVHACSIIGSPTPHLNECMASHLTNHFCKLCYAKPWGSLFNLHMHKSPYNSVICHFLWCRLFHLMVGDWPCLNVLKTPRHTHKFALQALLHCHIRHRVLKAWREVYAALVVKHFQRARAKAMHHAHMALRALSCWRAFVRHQQHKAAICSAALGFRRYLVAMQ